VESLYSYAGGDIHQDGAATDADLSIHLHLPTIQCA